MQAGHPITVVGARKRFTRVVKLIPKVAAKDSKNKGYPFGGDGSSATGPKNEVYPVVALGLAPKGRFSRRESSCPPGSRSVTRGQNEVYPVCELDSTTRRPTFENEVYPVRRLMSVPLGTAAK
jgi:hypothetical protein